MSTETLKSCYRGVEFIVQFVLAAAALLFCTAGLHAAPGPITTAQGSVVGMVTGPVETFFGVPYATPPVGALRWQSPQPPQLYPGGVLQATSYGAPCVQSGQRAGREPRESEDCLFLNIWRPLGISAGAELPVLVNIHGGAFEGGTGEGLDGAPLVTTGNIIFITLNYRLNAFGWLALPGLDEETVDGASSGNYGLLDMVAALRWINQNVRAFGGDPKRVTIAGQAAGGTGVCLLLAAPLKEKLFHRAIIESGQCQPGSQFAVTHQQNVANSVAFAVKLGCTDPAEFPSCLRAAPASALVAATAGLPIRHLPNVGGALVPLQLYDAFQSGLIADVPVIVGSNHDERKSDTLPSGFPGTVVGYDAFMTSRFATLATVVSAKYPVSRYPDPDYAAGAAASDSGAVSGIGVCPNLIAAADALAVATRTYAYELKDSNAGSQSVSPPGFEVGSQLNAQTKFLYNNAAILPPGIRPDEQAMAGSMLRYWASFVATGRPDDGHMKWPRYQPGREVVLRFQPNGNVAVSRALVSNDHNCAFWADLGY